MTVQEIINGIIQKTGLESLPSDKTCDQLMVGDPEMEVKKIVTIFMTTMDVIREAIETGANFIITHEPTWFTGMDQTDWLCGDPVYEEKRKLLEAPGSKQRGARGYRKSCHHARACGILSGAGR